MSAPVASRLAPLMHVITRPSDGFRLLVCLSLVNRPEAIRAAPRTGLRVHPTAGSIALSSPPKTGEHRPMPHRK
jgi:hypothetical protein